MQRMLDQFRKTTQIRERLRNGTKSGAVNVGEIEEETKKTKIRERKRERKILIVLLRLDGDSSIFISLSTAHSLSYTLICRLSAVLLDVFSIFFVHHF